MLEIQLSINRLICYLNSPTYACLKKIIQDYKRGEEENFESPWKRVLANNENCLKIHKDNTRIRALRNNSISKTSSRDG